ncbi:MAG: DUF2922 domain-containing protein, partial [Eubacterium sp.]
EDGGEYRMTVPDYKEAITDAEIKSGAQEIVTLGAFAPGGAALVKALSGVKVVTQKTEIAIEEKV